MNSLRKLTASEKDTLRCAIDGRNPLLAEAIKHVLELADADTPKFKVGDYVKVDDRELAVIIDVCYDDPQYPYRMLGVDDNLRIDGSRSYHRWGEDSLTPYDPKEQPTDNTITIPVKADIDDAYWCAYRAELVKELALKLAGSCSFRDAKEKAAYVLSYATEIVDNLKKQSE